MATFLDVSLLQNFTGVFTWLLVWVIAFGVLEMAKPMGEGKEGLHAIISVVLAFFVVLSGPANQFVQFIVPWLTVVGIAAFFIVFILLAYGNSMDDLMDWFDGAMKTWLIIIGVVVLIFGLSGALGGNEQQQAQQYPTQDQYQQGQYQGQQGQYQDQQYTANRTRNGTAAPTQPRSPGQQPAQGGQAPAYRAQQPSQSQEEGGFGATLVNTFTHPKVLGVIFLLVLANFTIVHLSKME